MLTLPRPCSIWLLVLSSICFPIQYCHGTSCNVKYITFTSIVKLRNVCLQEGSKYLILIVSEFETLFPVDSWNCWL